MAQFHTLTVTDIHRTIRDAVVLTLAPGDPAAFAFKQGQYLTFRRDFDGDELRRSYSICTGLDDGTLKVGIKRVDGGTFSTWANTELSIGDTVEAMPPMGKFTTDLDAASHKQYLMFAGGSGITPVLSIIRTLMTREPNARCTLVYANRAVSTIMFRDELEDMKNTYMQRLNVIHVLETDSQDIDLFTGRIDTAKCEALFANWIDIANVDTAFICGPEPMMLTIADSLRTHGLTDEQIKFELFASGQPGRAKKPALSTKDAAAQGSDARVTLDGESRSFKMPRDQSLLEAAIAHNVEAPFACKAGVCSTCRAKLLEGEVEMIANHALEDNEIADGYILTCQCYPLTDKVVWDYDAAGH